MRRMNEKDKKNEYKLVIEYNQLPFINILIKIAHLLIMSISIKTWKFIRLVFYDLSADPLENSLINFLSNNIL